MRSNVTKRRSVHMQAVPACMQSACAEVVRDRLHVQALTFMPVCPG